MTDVRPRKPRKVNVSPRPFPTIELFEPQTTSKSWGNEVLVANASVYTGKILHRLQGPQYHRAGLQIHTAKDETFHLYSGLAWVYFIRDERICKFMMTAGMSVHVPAGTIHSVQTVGESVMFEAAEYAPDSTTTNVEDQWDITLAQEISADRV